MTTLLYPLVKGLANPTMPLRGSWSRIPSTSVAPRTSHTLSVVAGKAYIFGGQTSSGKLYDNDLLVCTLPLSEVQAVDFESITPKPATGGADVPSPRAGHTASVVGSRIYIYGGWSAQGEPVDENGRVWVFDTKAKVWDVLDPVPASLVPPARYDHAATANGHPLPSPDLDGSGKSAAEVSIAPHGTLIVHAGRTASEDYSNDVWLLDIASRTWSELAVPAPGPGRVRTSLAFSHRTLYRFGGHDGTATLGGQVDTLEFAVSTFDDLCTKAEVALTPLWSKWRSLPSETAAFLTEPEPGPGSRSAAGFLPVSTGQGRSYLLLVGGERKVEPEGHSELWDDVWSLQTNPKGMTAASFKDAGREAVGRETGDGKWSQVTIAPRPSEPVEEKSISPRGRARFASATLDVDAGKIVLWAGLNETGEAVADAWILSIE